MAIVPTKPPWNVRARWVAPDIGVGKIRWIVDGRDVEVHCDSDVGSSKAFRELPGADEDTLRWVSALGDLR